jgi:dimethylamine/trimethylamine dehydrogenase
MGGVIAEKLRLDGAEVTYVTPAADVSHWTHNTMEQTQIQTRLLELGVKIIPLHNLALIAKDHVELSCVYTDARMVKPCHSVMLVTMRDSIDTLYSDIAALNSPDLKSFTRIGDCLAPGTIAAAIYSGHRFAREFGEPPIIGVPFLRELPEFANSLT